MTESESLDAALARRAELIDDALAERLGPRRPARLYEAAAHLFDAGGKRLRPILVLLVAEACGDERIDDADHGHVPAAVAVELVHTLSLIHDDIIDEDALRRGVPSVHDAWDRSTGILAGDLLYARALDVLLETRAPAERIEACSDVLVRSCRRLCEGQATDVEQTGREDVTEESYREMVEGKTGALFACAAEMGAILGGGGESVRLEAAAYGRRMGIAFQLYDDLLDVTTASSTLGKTHGSDLREGKQTLLLIHARQQGAEIDVEEHGVEHVVEVLEATGSIEYVRGRADDHVAVAKDHLRALPRCRARELLAELANRTVDRRF